MKTINIHEAKTHLSRIVERVAGGEEVIIGKAGKPMAKLIPYRTSPVQRKPGSLKGKIKIADSFDDYSDEVRALFEGRSGA